MGKAYGTTVDLRKTQYPVFGRVIQCSVRCKGCNWTGHRKIMFVINDGQSFSKADLFKKIENYICNDRCCRCCGFVLIVRPYRGIEG